MSKERKFHNLIEEQNPDEKQELWNRIESALKEENLAGEISVPKKKFLSWRKITALATSFVLVTTAIVLGGLKIFSGKEVPEDKSRYCTQNEYEVLPTQLTLKEYGEQLNTEILFFDWYAETESVNGYIYQLKSSEEVICFREEIVDINTGNLVRIYVTDNKTQIDILDPYKEICTNENQVSNIKVYWVSKTFRANTYFEYQNYRYFIELETPEDDGAILRLVEELLA